MISNETAAQVMSHLLVKRQKNHADVSFRFAALISIAGGYLFFIFALLPLSLGIFETVRMINTKYTHWNMEFNVTYEQHSRVLIKQSKKYYIFFETN